MNKLTKFSLANDVTILDKDLMEIVKGGRRYVTRSYSNYMAVCNSLSRCRIKFNTAVHGNEYCVEW